MPFTSGPKTQNTQESGRYRLSKRDIFRAVSVLCMADFAS